jgi:hypothetical protein
MPPETSQLRCGADIETDDKETGCGVWSRLKWLTIGLVVGSCEHSNVPNLTFM